MRTLKRLFDRDAQLRFEHAGGRVHRVVGRIALEARTGIDLALGMQLAEELASRVAEVVAAS